MKRGLIAWNRSELPPAAFEARLDLVRKTLAERGLPALFVYTDVWKSNEGRYFSNFMPYWNRALLAIPANDAPILLCGLSPRVYPWIRSVTIIDEIRPSTNLAGQLLNLCSEKGFKRIGALDFDRMPQDLCAPITAGSIEVVEMQWDQIHSQPDHAELSMYRQGLLLAREILDQELSAGVGLVDYEFAGRLERRLRRAGCEDLVLLMTNGDTAPAPAAGSILKDQFSATLAMEYRGHWVKLSRPNTSSANFEILRRRFDDEVRSFPDTGSTPVKLERLSGPYPYESCGPGEIRRR